MHFAINRNRLTYGIDLDSSTGIEIGPLVNPIVTREMSNVKYVDRASTEDLCEWYSKDDKIDVNDIMHIDYIWGDQSLSQATGGTEQFDYCIASHVIEHIPDLITWLKEIATILRVGGVACFAVPDKRYTFDYLRPLTTTADLVDCYLNKFRKPTFRHIYDHFSNFTELDIQTAWANDFDGSGLSPTNPPIHAYNACVDSINGDKYVDSHCSVFTEDTFFDLLESVSKLGLLDFAIKKRFEVKPGMFEFVVQLEKLNDELSPKQKHLAWQTSNEISVSSVLLMDFNCNQPCYPKIYYDIGEGFNEIDSIATRYNEFNSTVRLSFNLPSIEVLRIRFDPSEQQCKFLITNIELKDNNQRIPILVEALKPLNQIAKTNVAGNEFSAQTVIDANDPSILIDINLG